MRCSLSALPLLSFLVLHVRVSCNDWCVTGAAIGRSFGRGWLVPGSVVPACLRLTGEKVTVESISVVDNWEPQHLSYMRKRHAVETAHLCRDMMRVPPTFSFNP